MNTSEYKKYIYFIVIIFAFFLALLVGVIDRFEIGWQTLSRVFQALTATVVSWFSITEWWWKRWPFTVLLRVPVLEGTWTGHLQSNWNEGKGGSGPQIPIVFVIRQNLSSLTVLSFTKDRHGISHVAQILKNEAASTVKLAYLYSLRQEFKAGEGAQQGAAELRLLAQQCNELKGEYWTNTNTSGRLILTYQSLEKVGSFQEAKSKWKASWQGFS